jgi:biopolymer transport protein ExbD
MSIPPARRKHRSKAHLGLNLTSMIDVVFLLLVYFMVATDFTEGEEIYKLDLPVRQGAVAPDPFELDEMPLIVTVRSIGTKPQDLVIQLKGPYPEIVNPHELAEMLSKRKISVANPYGLFKADHPILIDPLPQSRWGHVIEVFNAPALAGYTNISFQSPDS